MTNQLIKLVKIAMEMSLIVSNTKAILKRNARGDYIATIEIIIDRVAEQQRLLANTIDELARI